MGSERQTAHRHRLPVDADGGGGDDGLMEPQASGISCSICLDLVSDNGVRSRAKLLCGHEFHLGKRDLSLSYSVFVALSVG